MFCGAFVFAVIMGMVVSVIKAVEAHNAVLRATLNQVSEFAMSRHVPARLTRLHRDYVAKQYFRTSGLDASEDPAASCECSRVRPYAEAGRAQSSDSLSEISPSRVAAAAAAAWCASTISAHAPPS